MSFRRWTFFTAPVAHGLPLIPDGYVELETANGILTAFVEVDLGHERLAVWKEKVRNYLQLAMSGEYERGFGQSQFRVLVVANSERRLLSIRSAVRALTQKVFWFATLESIESGNIFEPVWFRPEDSGRQALLPESQHITP